MSESLEQRIAPRTRLRLPLRIRWSGTDGFVECEATDFSRSGMFIALSTLPAAGVQLDVELVMPDGKRLLRGRVEVVRQQTQGPVRGVGTRFVNLVEDAAALLDRLVCGETHVGNYQLNKLIGKGGMAEVFKADVISGVRAGQTVAIKRLLPEFACDPIYVARFVAEADIGKALHHPNIAEVFEAGSVENTHFIAMEYVDGGTLSQLLRVCAEKNVLMPIDIAVHIAKAVAKALQHAHSLCAPSGAPYGIVHRDVTPSNIFVSYQGELKLGDFGAAHIKALDSEDENVLVGKPPYLAPEQIRGQPVSAQTDIFALGAVLFEMLTNQLAFPGETNAQIFKKITSGNPPRPSKLRPEICPKLDHAVRRALAEPTTDSKSTAWYRPRRSGSATRFATATAFLEALAPLSEPLADNPEVLSRFVRRMVK